MHHDDVLDALVQAEPRRLELDFAGLDFGKVEDVADQGKEIPAGLLEEIDIFLLFLGQFSHLQQLNHTEYAVHRSTDLVAHVSQKLTFGDIGGFGGGFGLE